MNRVRVLGGRPHTPTQFFREYPPGGNRLSWEMFALRAVSVSAFDGRVGHPAYEISLPQQSFRKQNVMLV